MNVSTCASTHPPTATSGTCVGGAAILLLLAVGCLGADGQGAGSLDSGTGGIGDGSGGTVDGAGGQIDGSGGAVDGTGGAVDGSGGAGGGQQCDPDFGVPADCSIDADCVVTTVSDCCGSTLIGVRGDQLDAFAANQVACTPDEPIACGCPSLPTRASDGTVVLGVSHGIVARCIDGSCTSLHPDPATCGTQRCDPGGAYCTLSGAALEGFCAPSPQCAQCSCLTVAAQCACEDTDTWPVVTCP